LEVLHLQGGERARRSVSAGGNGCAHSLLLFLAWLNEGLARWVTRSLRKTDPLVEEGSKTPLL